MIEFSSRVAHKTPTAFSDDIHTPFEDIGMGEWNNEQIAQFFDGKIVLDVGSGFEGIARRLFGIFSNSSSAPKVINLNPQFTDWRMQDVRINGERHSFPRYKQDDFEVNIRELMEMAGEDADGYFSTRIAVAGLVQQLPFANESIDVVASTWGFPRCLYDCGGSRRDHVAGYSEIVRVLTPAGVALLSPIPSPAGSSSYMDQVSGILEEINGEASPFEYDFAKVAEGQVLKIIKQG